MTAIATPPKRFAGSKEPFSPEEIDAIRADYLRDGYRLIRQVLSQQETRDLRAAVDRVFTDPKYKDNLYSPFIAVRLFETDPLFEDMLTREPIIGLAENLLGPDCHLIAQNTIRNAPGQYIGTFHVDDAPFMEPPEGESRIATNQKLPIYLLTVQVLLSDVESEEYGPTQFVPASHYSGRGPDDLKNPSFEGRGPQSICGRAGDIYLHNGQCWHRGAPNTSNRTRYLHQLAYGKRFISQRFFPFVNYQLPKHVLDRADDRRKRVLGFHPKGAYG